MRLLKLLAVVSLWAGDAALAQLAPAAPTAPPAATPAATTFSVATAKSTLSYDIKHKLHKVHGVSKRLEGKARIFPDGKAQVMVRVPAQSFDSDNVNRDAHVKEVIEAARFPAIEIKATAEGVKIPDSFPATVEKTFKAQVSFHGVSKTLDLPVQLVFESADSVQARGTANLGIEEFKIVRPSLMFVKIEDEMHIEANLVFTKG